ncbi:MAG: cation-translocating P-type ATPase, partial [Pseudomonadota bacterium]
MSNATRDVWRKRASDMASDGLRVLAVAACQIQDPELTLSDSVPLALVGLVGFRDPPRAGVRDAVRQCREAGLRIVLVTGDHVATACAIAEQVDLAPHPLQAMDGQEFEDHVAKDIGNQSILDTDVFARVTPEHKLQLVKAYQARGDIVAMTGDGVNDAPALKRADIGVAMGQRGTDVARQASDMVLLDDAFPTIVTAVKNGRIIFENIRRFVVYLLSCNLSEVLVIALAILFGLPLALLPLQILFLNLVTDVFPAFALATGRGEDNVLKRSPRPVDEQIVGASQWSLIVFNGLVITAVTLVSLIVALRGLGLDGTEAT